MEFRLPASVVSKRLCPQVSFPIPCFAFLRHSFTVWPRLALSSWDCCLGLSVPWLQLCTIVFPWEWMGHRHRLQMYKWQWEWQWWVAIRRSGHRSLCVCMCVYLSVCLSSTHTHTHIHSPTVRQEWAFKFCMLQLRSKSFTVKPRDETRGPWHPSTASGKTLSHTWQQIGKIWYYKGLICQSVKFGIICNEIVEHSNNLHCNSK